MQALQVNEASGKFSAILDGCWEIFDLRLGKLSNPWSAAWCSVPYVYFDSSQLVHILCPEGVVHVRVRLRATAAAAVCSICIAASASVPAIQAVSDGPEQHRTVSTQAYVLTSNDGTLSPASIGSLASVPGVQTSAAAAPAPSLFTAIQPVFTVLGGALSLPFNIPFWYATGQLNAAANQTAINNFVTALGQLPGVPAAVLSYLAGIPTQTA
ncbi:MAG: hypothetical protein ACRDUS_05510, partial [Mycobacterium sp.]